MFSFSNKESSREQWKKTAHSVCRELYNMPQLTESEKAELLNNYMGIVKEVQPKISQYIKMSSEMPIVEVVDSYDWIDRNIDSGLLSRVMNYGNELYAKKSKELREREELPSSEMIFLKNLIGKGIEQLMQTFMGMQYAFLSSIILGQYDSNLFESEIVPGRVYFVHPNIEKMSKVLDLDTDEFRGVIVVHEITHDHEFSNNFSKGWLKKYMESKIDELFKKSFESMLRSRDSFRYGEQDPLEKFRKLLEGKSLMELTLPEEALPVFNQMNAAMSLLEGYSDHVAEALDFDSFHEMKMKMEARRSKSPSLLEKIMGVDVKRKQYEVGKAFVDGIVKNESIEFLNRTFESENNLPDMSELQDPKLWVARIKSFS